MLEGASELKGRILASKVLLALVKHVYVVTQSIPLFPTELLEALERISIKSLLVSCLKII
jgi:hypothetical protein